MTTSFKNDIKSFNENVKAIKNAEKLPTRDLAEYEAQQELIDNAERGLFVDAIHCAKQAVIARYCNGKVSKERMDEILNTLTKALTI